jgi:putative IMPACT (imprinted ancient) family translation regulator
VNEQYQISFPYDATNGVMKILKDEQLKIVSQRFDMRSELVVEIRQSKTDGILHKLQKIEGLESELLPAQ